MPSATASALGLLIAAEDVLADFTGTSPAVDEKHMARLAALLGVAHEYEDEGNPTERWAAAAAACRRVADYLLDKADWFDEIIREHEADLREKEERRDG